MRKWRKVTGRAHNSFSRTSSNSAVNMINKPADLTAYSDTNKRKCGHGIL